MEWEAELKAEFERVRADLMSIDEQLAVRRLAVADWDEDFRRWRGSAVIAKQRKTAELIRIKQALAKLKEA